MLKPISLFGVWASWLWASRQLLKWLSRDFVLWLHWWLFKIRIIPVLKVPREDFQYFQDHCNNYRIYHCFDIHDQIYFKWGKPVEKYHFRFLKDHAQSYPTRGPDSIIWLQVAKVGNWILQNKWACWRGCDPNLLHWLLCERVHQFHGHVRILEPGIILQDLLHQVAHVMPTAIPAYDNLVWRLVANLLQRGEQIRDPKDKSYFNTSYLAVFCPPQHCKASIPDFLLPWYWWRAAAEAWSRGLVLPGPTQFLGLFYRPAWNGSMGYRNPSLRPLPPSERIA